MVIISLNMGFVDKLKTKFHKKSIDQEIDEAFDDSGSYSKKVLEGSSKQNPENEQLSSNYRLESQQEPPTPLMEPGMQNQDTLSNQQIQDTNDPFTLPKGADRPPPQADKPLQMPETHHSMDEQKRDFFNQPRLTGGAGTASSDVNTILLELKDLRTQNEHILDLLKNIQDRLRGH